VLPLCLVNKVEYNVDYNVVFLKLLLLFVISSRAPVSVVNKDVHNTRSKNLYYGNSFNMDNSDHYFTRVR